MKKRLAILYGQAPEFSTSFQTRELARHLAPWFHIDHFEVPSSASPWKRQLLRLKHNLFTKVGATDFLLYGNDGLCDLRRFKTNRILYWYDAPEDWSQTTPRSIKDRIRCANVRAAEHVFAVSAAQVAVAKRLRPGREDSVHYLPVGVDCSFFDPHKIDGATARQRFGFASNEIVIGYLGYLGHWKNRFAGEALLEAATALKDHKFLIIGSGPALEDWKRHAAQLGLLDRFTFTGFIPQADLPAALAATDICVDTLEPGFHSEARSETKLKQYMAMGRPCVATDLGENRVDLDHGNAGVLVAPNANHLAKAIQNLARDPAARERFGHAARERAEAVYHWGVLAEKMAASILT